MAPRRRGSRPGAPVTMLGSGSAAASYWPLDAPGGPKQPASVLEATLLNRLALAGLPAPERQFKFCASRRWRADFAYPAAMLLIEADGATWTGGRHVRGKGFEADCEKTSTAAALGYRVIRVTRGMIEDGRAVELIRQALEI
jgi:very-short-patch-repair endonuclease